MLSLSGNWFSQPSEGKAAETKFSAQLTYVRTWWRLGSSILSSPVPPRWFPSPSSPPTSWFAVGTMAFTSSLELLSAQRADAPPLEPSLEALLREVNCHEEVIMAFRVQEIVDRGLFVALDSSEEGIRKTAQEAFGIDPEKGFAHKRELAKVVKAWSTARVQNEAKTKVDATARAHGEAVSMLNSDWTSLMRKFRDQYGKHLKEEDLPAQSYYEQFEESLADGCLQAERLTHVVTAREAGTRSSAWSALGLFPHDPNQASVHVKHADDDGAVPRKVRGHVELLVARQTSTVRQTLVLGPH